MREEYGMNNPLAGHYSTFSLFLFALPGMVMMVFLSLYTIVDGIFISRFVGTLALSAINITYPLVGGQLAVSIMIASGGSAAIARKQGEGKEEEARRDFSFIVLALFCIGVIIAVIGTVFTDSIVCMLGASRLQFDLCRTYARIFLAFCPCFFLQSAFQIFFTTAGRPELGLVSTVCAGLANILFDYIFIVICKWGVAGAATGTVIGYCIPSVTGLFFFTFSRKSRLRFVKPAFDLKLFFRACVNGSSEMVTNLASAVTTYLFNYSFMKFYGEDGVASIAIVLYFQFVFSAVFFGYSSGIAPIVSYKYGAADISQLKKIFRSSLFFLSVGSVVTYGISRYAIRLALTAFTQSDSPVFAIAINGFHLFAISFLFMGFGIFASAFFTAFSDGKVSAIISFARTFVFLVGAILLLPIFFEKTGVWLAVPVAECMGAVVSAFFLISKSKKYRY